MKGAAMGTMLLLGIVALLASVIYTSSILAIIGLGLVFWGAILLYVEPEEHIRKVILDALILPSLMTLNRIVDELDYKGDATYLPPRYFQNPENSKIYIPKQKDAHLPTPEQIQRYENQIFIKSPQALLLTPPGAELTRLFEKRLKTSFNNVDLNHLQQNLPRLFTEDLEIAENLKIEIPPKQVLARRTSDSLSLVQAEYYMVHVRITDPICKEICEESNKLTHICGRIGCPICSSIGCALTKATGAPVMIEIAQTSKDEKTIEVVYRVLRVPS
jgi:hypothetical protein